MNTDCNIELELSLARNMFGKLDPRVRTRIEAVVSNPCEQTWDDAYCVIIGSDGWMTLWQAVVFVDPSYTGIGKVTDADGTITKPWAAIPDRRTLIKALEYATH